MKYFAIQHVNKEVNKTIQMSLKLNIRLNLIRYNAAVVIKNSKDFLLRTRERSELTPCF